MSEKLREGRPLLRDEYSDEEVHFGTSSPKFRRLRHSSSFGRARTHTIGAAAIINQWPDHLSSLLNYWWMGVIMIILIIFVIYNSIITFASLPTAHPRPFKFKNFDHSSQNTSDEKNKTEIYMHVFVTDFEDFSNNKYLKHISMFSNKYSNYMYNVIVIFKDTFNDSLNDQINNDIALNSLWMESKKQDKIQINENTNVEILSLSQYMDDSPIQKYWRHLPLQFLGFLARCVAIWERGGVAFDPIILTENTPNSMYVVKLEQVLSNFGSRFKKIKTSLHSPKKKINNIRDVIENLEDLGQSIEENNLVEAENKKSLTEIINLNGNESEKENNKNTDLKRTESKRKEFSPLTYKKNNLTLFSEESEQTNVSTNESAKTYQEEMNGHNFIPMFLKYLFPQPTNKSESTNEQSHFVRNVALKEPTLKVNNKTSSHDKKYSHKNKKSTSKNNHHTSLTIDLKGIMIATETPCHAFIGTIFSNVLKHSHKESITDLIVEELTTFCKGVFSLCNGVDVILL